MIWFLVRKLSRGLGSFFRFVHFLNKLRMNYWKASRQQLYLLFFFLFFYSSFSAFAQQSLVRDLKPGETRNSYIDLMAGDSLALSLIKGIADGPVFTIVAGVHGYEYPPIMAVQRVLKSINPAQLKGTLIILPVANESSFYGRSAFVNPKDGKNLNRSFPGNSQGTATEKIAAFISEEIIPISDVFLDVHGGDASEDLLPFVCFYDRKDAPEQVELARKLTEAAGFEYNVVYPYNLGPEQPSQYAFKEAVQQGKTALSIEAGKLGNVQEENVSLIEQGIMNMLMEMEMLPGPVVFLHDQKWLDNQVYIKAPVKGIFYSKVKSGDSVSEGQLLGYITDVFGMRIEEVLAPAGGLVLYKIGTPPVNSGETLFCIGN